MDRALMREALDCAAQARADGRIEDARELETLLEMERLAAGLDADSITLDLVEGSELLDPLFDQLTVTRAQSRENLFAALDDLVEFERPAPPHLSRTERRRLKQARGKKWCVRFRHENPASAESCVRCGCPAFKDENGKLV